MQKSPLILFIPCILIFFSLTLDAQQNVGFNHLTGTANVNIPIYIVGNVPISVNYSASGIKVRQTAGMVGLGWNLNAGGSIVRKINGIADDTPYIGWMHNTVGSKINNFSENISSPCTDQSLEYDALNEVYEEKDTEPDVFYINTPFVSGKFVFNNTSPSGLKPEIQPYQDLLIDYTLGSSGSGRIESFILTDDIGVKYEFSAVDQSDQATVFKNQDLFLNKMQDHQIGITNDVWHLTKIIKPNGQYVVFDYYVIINNESITIKSELTGVARNYFFKGSSVNFFGTPTVSKKTNVLQSITSSEGEKIKFIISTRNDGMIDNRLTRIERYYKDQLISSYNFYYKDVYPDNFQSFQPTIKDKEYEKRTFLKAIYPKYDGTLYAGYEFDYHGVYGIYNKLPSHASAAVDIYGFYNKKGLPSGNQSIYYNPALDECCRYRTEPLPNSDPDKKYEVIQVRELIPTIYYNPALDPGNQYRINPLPIGHVDKGTEILIEGYDRSVDPNGLHYGSLSKLTYPTGGNTRFFYEPNVYHDPTAGADYFGPGIRLKKTIIHDGVSNANNIVTNYSYNNDNGIASGVVVSRPSFAFSTPYSPNLQKTYAEIMTLNPQSQAEALSIRTNFDLSSGDHSVLYQQVSVLNKGSGKTVYNFSIPATLDVQVANGGEWTATQNGNVRMGSSSDCYELGRFTTGSNVYPFGDNPNYGFERGLLTSVKSLDENNNPVSQTQYEYVRTNPTGLSNEIYGMKIDKIPTYKPSIGIGIGNQAYFFAFGKYKVFSNVRNSISKVIKTIFDPQDNLKTITTETDYLYNAAHGRLSETKVINSDGAISKSYNKYVADYAIGTPDDLETRMLDSLQQKHQNALTVENYSTIKTPGDVETIVTGSLLTYNDFDQNVLHPYKNYALDKIATVPKSAFQPSIVNGGLFEKDPNYELKMTNSHYDINEKQSGSIDEVHKKETGIHWGYIQQKPFAEISNAKANQFIYSGFEDETEADFKYETQNYPNDPFGIGRTGQKALQMETGITHALAGEIRKDVKTDHWILSLWVDSQNTGSINCNIESLDGSTTYQTATVNFQQSDGWKYFESRIDVTGLSPAAYSVTLSTNSTIKIDDILLYPEEASVGYRSFGMKGELMSESIAGKTTTYYEYDEMLRRTLTRDDDKNIVSKMEYSDIEVDPPLNPFFRYLGRNSNGESVFELDDTEATGLDYTWYFGNDSDPDGVPMTGQSRIKHTYAVQGTHTVRLQVTNGSENASSSQTIGNKFYKVPSTGEEGPTAEICAAGPMAIINCVVTPYADGCQSTTGNQIAPTVFSVDEITNCADCETMAVNYSWQVKIFPDDWQVVGTQPSISLMYSHTFYVRCVITFGTANPIVITSNTKWVKVLNSTTCTSQ